MTVLALAVLATYALLDKYGGQIVERARAVRAMAAAGREPRTDP